MRLVVFGALLGGSVWAGGLVAIAVAAVSARRELDAAVRAAFFRTLGRGYLRVGGAALAVALGCGLALLARGSWNGEKTAAVAAGAGLVLVTAAAVGQARRLGAAALRGRSRDEGGRVRRADLLRGAMAILTLVELALAAVLSR